MKRAIARTVISAASLALVMTTGNIWLIAAVAACFGVVVAALIVEAVDKR